MATKQPTELVVMGPFKVVYTEGEEPLDAVADVGEGKCICWMQVS